MPPAHRPLRAPPADHGVCPPRSRHELLPLRRRGLPHRPTPCRRRGGRVREHQTPTCETNRRPLGGGSDHPPTRLGGQRARGACATVTRLLEVGTPLSTKYYLHKAEGESYGMQPTPNVLLLPRATSATGYYYHRLLLPPATTTTGGACAAVTRLLEVGAAQAAHQCASSMQGLQINLETSDSGSEAEEVNCCVSPSCRPGLYAAPTTLLDGRCRRLGFEGLFTSRRLDYEPLRRLTATTATQFSSVQFCY